MILRAFVRLVLFVALVACVFFSWLASLPLALIAPALQRRCRGEIFHLWAKLTVPLLGVRIRRHGEPPLAPTLLVSNHLSYLDIAVLASQVRTVFIAKSEVESWPILGFLCRAMGTIFIDRSLRGDLVRVIEKMENTFRIGHGIIVFPEGTSTDGSEVKRFFPPLFEASVRQGQPARWASLRYSTAPDDPPAREAVCWWGDMTFPDHFWNLMKLRRIDVDLTFGAKPIAATNRKEMARRLHAEVSASLSL